MENQNLNTKIIANNHLVKELNTTKSNEEQLTKQKTSKDMKEEFSDIKNKKKFELNTRKTFGIKKIDPKEGIKRPTDLGNDKVEFKQIQLNEQIAEVRKIPQQSEYQQLGQLIEEQEETLKIPISIRKKWNPEAIQQLLVMNKEQLPIKVMAKFFDVSPNAISKTLQRYCEGYSNQTYKVSSQKKITKAPKNFVLEWMKKNKEKILKITKMPISIHHKAFLVNEILYENNLIILTPLDVDNYLKILIRETKNNLCEYE